MKFQPLKNFKYKYLFGDKIPKGDGAFSSHIHVDVLLPIPFVMEHQCEVMDLVLAQKTLHFNQEKKEGL
jgi:hypothetical protein